MTSGSHSMVREGHSSACEMHASYKRLPGWKRGGGISGMRSQGGKWQGLEAYVGKSFS